MEDRAVELNLIRNTRADAAKEIYERRAWVEKYCGARTDIRGTEVMDWLMELADEIQGNCE